MPATLSVAPTGLVQNTARSQRLRAGLMYAAPFGGSFVEARDALLFECSLFEGARCFRVLYVQGAPCFRVLHGSRCSMFSRRSMLECSMLEGAPMLHGAPSCGCAARS